MNTDEIPSLLKCPFCGGAAELEDCTEHDPELGVTDELWLCGCRACDIMFYGKRADVVSRWNQRANTPAQPVYKDDVLDQLRHQDGLPASLLQIGCYLSAVTQNMARAADEIERLRTENDRLKSK